MVNRFSSFSVFKRGFCLISETLQHLNINCFISEGFRKPTYSIFECVTKRKLNDHRI